MLKKIFLIPVHFLLIFTQDKSFKDNILIGSRTLNLLGLHIFRIIISHSIFRFRQFLLTWCISREDRKSFLQNGYLVKEDFLPKDIFKKIDAEARLFKGEARQNIQGTTLVKRLFLDFETLSKNPKIKELEYNKNFSGLMKFCSATNEIPRLYIEEVNQNADATRPDDPQQNFHSDTFHPTMKAWLFLDDVSDDNGPFCYIKHSHKLSWKRLKWEYRKSVSMSTEKDQYSHKGSMRAEQSDLTLLGLDKNIVKLYAKKNTLIIANTHGFHCRGTAKQKSSSRLAIWASSRTNPFNPIPGLDSAILRRIRDKVMLKHQSYKDWQAEKKNQKPSWHKV
jgi:hypothetical protein